MSRPDIQPESSHREVFRPTATLLDKLYRFQSSLRLGSPTIFVGNTTHLRYASEDYKGAYRNTTCAVKSEGSISDWFKIVTGVRQGDIWSPLLFGLAIDFVMKIAVDKDNRGLLSKFPGFIFKPNRLVKMTKLLSDLK